MAFKKSRPLLKRGLTRRLRRKASTRKMNFPRPLGPVREINRETAFSDNKEFFTPHDDNLFKKENTTEEMSFGEKVKLLEDKLKIAAEVVQHYKI